jgi:hypothetical protein
MPAGPITLKLAALAAEERVAEEPRAVADREWLEAIWVVERVEA